MSAPRYLVLRDPRRWQTQAQDGTRRSHIDGTELSRHRTPAAAERALQALQSRCRRIHGRDSYLDLVLVAADGSAYRHLTDDENDAADGGAP